MANLSRSRRLRVGATALLAAATLAGVPAAAVAQGPEFAIDPSSAPAGSAVVVTGTGWDQSLGPVSIFSSIEDVIGPTPSPPLVAPSPSPSPMPDASGSFSTTIVVPFLAPATYTFVACQECSPKPRELAREPFAVEPSAPTLTLSATSGTPAAKINAVGTGWDPANGTVSIFPSRSDATTPGSALATRDPDVAGSFTVAMVAPADPLVYDLYACQRCGSEPAAEQTASFTVVASPPPTRVAVPRLVGLDTRRAQELIDVLHLTLAVTWRGSGSDVGIVASQFPRAGRHVPPGTTVRVTATRTAAVAPVGRRWPPAATAGAVLIALAAIAAAVAALRLRPRRWVRRHIRTEPRPDVVPEITRRRVGDTPDLSVRIEPHEDRGTQTYEEVGS